MLPDLSIPGYPNVFVVGDMAAVDGVPGVAQGAIQGGKYAAALIKAELAGADPAQREPFQYFDKGSMAAVSRYYAVVKIGPVEFGGIIGWFAWLLLHLVYLIGFKNKITTVLSWIVTFLSGRRGQLTITEQQAFARTRLEQLAVLAAEAHEDETAKGQLVPRFRDSAAAPDRGRPVVRRSRRSVTCHNCWRRPRCIGIAVP